MAAKKKREPRRIHPPSREEFERLAGAMPSNSGLLVIVAAWSGLRIFEVCALEKRDVTDCGDFARLTVRNGKGYRGPKRRQAILLKPGFDVVKELPGWTFGPDTMPLVPRLPNQLNKDRWDRKAAWHALAKGREAAGLEHLIFHDFRKFYATHLLNSGVNPMDVAVALGHLDRNGQPDTELVRRVYGFVNHDQALDRAVEVANVIGTGEVVGAASVGVVSGERDQDGTEGSQGARPRGGPQSARGFERARAGVGEHEGVGFVGDGAEGGAGEGAPFAAARFRVSLENARRALGASASRDPRVVAREGR